MTGPLTANERMVIVGGAGILIIVGLLLWRRKRSSVC
jgi:LPXTG-motif cell wall-anchored protein